MDARQKTKSTGKLILYDSMISAIGLCSKVDEVKDIRDKALALEHYARQATNVDAERQAINVRVRAERRAGEILKGLQKGKGGGDRKSDHRVRGKHSGFVQAKWASSITDSQATQWQQTAAMPEEKFVEKIEDMKRKVETRRKPRGPKVKPVPDRALLVWGEIKDFERMNILDLDPNEVMKEMLDSMKPDIRRVVPKLIGWLKRFNEEEHVSGRDLWPPEMSCLHDIDHRLQRTYFDLDKDTQNQLRELIYALLENLKKEGEMVPNT